LIHPLTPRKKTRNPPKHSRQSPVSIFLLNPLEGISLLGVSPSPPKALGKMQSKSPEVHTPQELPITPETPPRDQFPKTPDGSPKGVIAPATPIAIVDENLRTLRVSL
jgi:hypothetical protein